MFNKILVAMDSVDEGKRVFDQALPLAKAVGASLMLLHVLSIEEEGYPNLPVLPTISYYPGLSDVSIDAYQKQWQTFEQRGLARLKAHVETARLVGVTADCTQTLGVPGRVICDLARKWQADLILMGSRGRAGLSELLLGSVSNYVMHHAPCSVLVMRSPKTSQGQGTAPPVSKSTRNQPTATTESHAAGWQ